MGAQLLLDCRKFCVFDQKWTNGAGRYPRTPWFFLFVDAHEGFQLLSAKIRAARVAWDLDGAPAELGRPEDGRAMFVIKKPLDPGPIFLAPLRGADATNRLYTMNRKLSRLFFLVEDSTPRMEF